MKFLLPAFLALAAFTTGFAQAPVNPGFEDGATGWSLDSMSSVVPEAANTGKLGLRIADNSPDAGSAATSGKIPVTPGSTVELRFQARTQTSGFIGVYLFFYDQSGKLIKEESQRAGAGHPVVGVSKADGQWSPYSLKATVPPNAADVAIWVHSFGKAVGTADFDDFEFEGASGAAAAAAQVPPPAPKAPVVIPQRAKPPLIVIKIDDFRPINNGNLHGIWVKVIDYLASKNAKAGIGVNPEKLGEASPALIEWVKKQHDSGEVEFWFHGWDHATHEVDGVQYNEFNKRPYDEQKKRFDDGQAITKEKFGFTYNTFGPPGGASNGFGDANTYKVMADEPDMKVWLYPQPMDKAALDLQAGGKVTVLDRVWAVNLESKVGQPDFQRFLEGYAKNPDREYFVLQGHPMSWGTPEKWTEFTKIIDFLVEQKAEFLTPSELAARVKSSN